MLLKTLLHDLFGCDLGIFHRSPAQCFNRLGIRRTHVRSELKRQLWPIYQWSSCPREVLSPSVQLRLAVAIPAELPPFGPDVSSALPYPISPEHQSSLRLKCCFVISLTPRAPLPRLSIYLFIHVLEVCTLDLCPWIPTVRPTPIHAVPQYSTTTRPQTTTSHVNSRMLPGVTSMQCVSAETPREDSDRSVCATHCEQWLQQREQKTLTETSQEVTRSADACLSLARVALNLCVVQVVRIRATKNWCTSGDCGARMSVTGN